MHNGVIPRTRLLQPGQSIANLPHGWHDVTGGRIKVGLLPSGNVPRILGIMVDGYPTTPNGWIYHQGNQPFNRNFAKVLYEVYAAGKSTCSYTTIDYTFDGKGGGQTNAGSRYLQAFRASRGLGLGPQYHDHHGELTITKKLLNALAEQEN